MIDQVGMVGRPFIAIFRQTGSRHSGMSIQEKLNCRLNHVGLLLYSVRIDPSVRAHETQCTVLSRDPQTLNGRSPGFARFFGYPGGPIMRHYAESTHLVIPKWPVFWLSLRRLWNLGPSQQICRLLP
jgi:hypothetical protein